MQGWTGPAHPPHAIATVRPMMAKDAQNDGKVSTLSGWDAVVVCRAHTTF